MAFPTSNGNIPTTELAGLREAATDLRYLATLLTTIGVAQVQGKNTSQAEAYVAWLKTADLKAQNLDTVRATLVDHILSLEQVPLRKMAVTVAVTRR
jgi:hypothetical protein